MYPFFQVRWDREGSRHLPRGSEVQGVTLRMSNVQPHDAGRYWCSLTDRDGKLQREYVELRVERKYRAMGSMTSIYGRGNYGRRRGY